MRDRLTAEEERILASTILEVNEKGWGIALGCTLAVGLFVATNILVLKGGSDVGSHLGLLRVYFPGYRVTFIGSLIGFVYAFVLGYGLGRTVIGLYNRLNRRDALARASQERLEPPKTDRLNGRPTHLHP